MPATSLEAISVQLKRSPMFQLSLASKELFHSNFLAWLCETYPKQVAHLFGSVLGQPCDTCEPRIAKREWKKFDLWIEFSSRDQVLIENKVKSLPTRQQLEEYADKIKPKDRPRTRFVLLSLTRPSFLRDCETSIKLENGVEWQYLDYEHLAEHLKALAPVIHEEDPYHGEVLQDYLALVGHLHALQSRYRIDFAAENGDFFAAQKGRKCLCELRLHDVVDKLRYGQLSARVYEVLRQDGFSVDCRSLPIEALGAVAVSSGMTRGVGLSDMKYVVVKDETFGPVHLGVQVQGRQFRLIVEMKRGGDKAASRRVAESLLRAGTWFDFQILPNARPTKNEFNQFNGIFYYLWTPLESISPQRLAEAIVAYARQIRSTEVTLRDRIQAALHAT